MGKTTLWRAAWRRDRRRSASYARGRAPRERGGALVLRARRPARSGARRGARATSCWSAVGAVTRARSRGRRRRRPGCACGRGRASRASPGSRAPTGRCSSRSTTCSGSTPRRRERSHTQPSPARRAVGLLLARRSGLESSFVDELRRSLRRLSDVVARLARRGGAASRRQRPSRRRRSLGRFWRRCTRRRAEIRSTRSRSCGRSIAPESPSRPASRCPYRNRCTTSFTSGCLALPDDSRALPARRGRSCASDGLDHRGRLGGRSRDSV